MTDLAVTDALFFERTGMDPVRIEALVAEALDGMDDGELFLEYSQAESLALDDGRIKSASFNTAQGFGLRAVADAAAGYARASELSEASIRRAAGDRSHGSRGARSPAAIPEAWPSRPWEPTAASTP